MELLEALRLREVADFLLLLCLLSFLPLVLRPLPMENAARWKRLERLPQARPHTPISTLYHHVVHQQPCHQGVTQLWRWSTLRCCKGREVQSSHMQPLPCAHRGPTRYL